MGRAEKIDSGANGEVVFYRSHYQISTKNGIDSPQRMFTEPLLNAGEATGQVIRRMDTLLNEYYNFLGYDQNGVPTPKRLKQLGLKEITEDLKPTQK